MSIPRRSFVLGSLGVVGGALAGDLVAADKDVKAKTAAKKAPAKPATPALEFPPKLPGGKIMVTDQSEAFLSPGDTLQGTVIVAKEPPKVDFMYYPGQNYEGKIWSNWGEGTASHGKYYSAVGDHDAPAGNAQAFEYDPKAKTLKSILDLKSLLKLPEGHYSPSKIHTRIERGSDGWVYCATHRGSTNVTNDQYHYKGDWIVRANPETGKQEIVVHAPVPKHCLPTGRIDAERLIFYGASHPGVEKKTADGGKETGNFFAYDIRSGKMLYSGPNGPSRSMILSRSTGKVYYSPGTAGATEGPLVSFDPAKPGEPKETGLTMGIRAATDETADGIVYAASHSKDGSMLYEFNTKNETLKTISPAAVGEQQYVASLAIDPIGRYVYYVPGAHGGSERDGSPLVQYDTRRKRRKVIAFLEPFYTKQYGLTLKGTYSVAVDSTGGQVFITWNVSRGSKAWDCCGLTVVHVPESEREV